MPVTDAHHTVCPSWSQAQPEQKKRLVSEFRNMLVRTYSNAISAYQGQTLKVLPSRGKADAEDTVVRTQFVRAGGQPYADPTTAQFGKDRVQMAGCQPHRIH